VRREPEVEVLERPPRACGATSHVLQRTLDQVRRQTGQDDHPVGHLAGERERARPARRDVDRHVASGRVADADAAIPIGPLARERDHLGAQ